MKIIKESGTDRAKEALSKYIDDIDYLNDGIEMIVKNTEWLYDQYRNKRIKTHGVVWSGLLELIRSDLHEPLTSSQLQAGFKALGIDYKEFLEPIVKNMEEMRNDELVESTLIEVPEEDIIDDSVEVIEEDINNDKFKYSYSPEEIYDYLVNDTGWTYEDMGYDSIEEFEDQMKQEVEGIEKIISESELVIIDPDMGEEYPGFESGKVKLILTNGKEFIGDADEENGLPLINVVDCTLVYPVDQLDKDDPLLESKAEEEGLEEIVNKLDKVGATPDNILDSDIKSKYDSVLSKLGVELNKGEVPFIYKVTKNGKQIGRINYNKVAKKWEFRISTISLEGKDTTVSEYLKELSEIKDFEIVQAFKKAIKYGVVSNKVVDYIINDCILNKDLKRESKSTVNYGTIADKINELEVELDVLSNDDEVDQKEIRSIKDKIYRLSKKLTECLHKLPSEINEDKDKNIENIKSALKSSGIKNERTLDLMSKDVLKTLQSNYDKDCKDQEGNYYNPAITSAIQDVIQRITGSRPKASFGESLKTERFHKDFNDKNEVGEELYNIGKEVWKDFWEEQSEIYNQMVRIYNDSYSTNKIYDYLKSTQWAKNMKKQYNLNDVDFEDLIWHVTTGWEDNSMSSRMESKTYKEGRVKELLFANKEITESAESSDIIDMFEKRDTPYIKTKDGKRMEIRVNDENGSFEFRTLDDVIEYTAKDENELNKILNQVGAEIIDTDKLMR